MAKWNDEFTGIENCSCIHPRGSKIPNGIIQKRSILRGIMLTLLRAECKDLILKEIKVSC